MSRRVFLLLSLSCCGLLGPGRAADLPGEAGRAPSAAELTPTQAEKDARLGWFREARFGLFIHWGVYSQLGGTFKGQKKMGYAEHIQRALKIPILVYLKEVAGEFNPTKFDAETWVKMAKATGMGYIIITAKHHDGFAMYDSKVSEHTIVKATPFARDPMKELKAACVKHGLKFGFYYSHAFDWGEKDGAGNDWDYDNPGGDRYLHTKFGNNNWWETYPEFLPRVRKYVDEKAIPQIQELVKNYDPDVLWFDTPHKIPPEENRRILAAVRAAKPTLVVNGRLIEKLGDYKNTTDMPIEVKPQTGDWEAIPTTNRSYGYNQNELEYKTPEYGVRILAKAAARGGNVLFNVGPMGSGLINEKDLAIFNGIGQWWKVYGEASIRGTTATPLTVQAWGESTRKGNQLYLHVFDWPKDGKLVVGGLKTEATGAALVNDPAKALPLRRAGPDLVIDVPKEAPNAYDSVVVVTCAAAPEGDPARLISSTQANVLRGLDAKITNGLKYGSGSAKECGILGWTQVADRIDWPARVREETTYEVAINYDAPAASVRKVVEGDAGKEVAPARVPAGGTYRVNLGTQALSGSVRTGVEVSDRLGRVTLPVGALDLSVTAGEITGEELMRVRSITLTPVETKNTLK